MSRVYADKKDITKKRRRTAPESSSVGRKLKSKLKIFSVRSGLDLPLFFITLLLLIIGLIMLFSASYPNAYYFQKGDSYYFIRSQLIWAVIGVAAMIAISYFDYHHFHKLAVPILILSFVLLIIVLFSSFIELS